MIENTQQTNYVIIASVDKNYLLMFQIWHSQFKKLKLKTELVVLTFDDESFRVINNKKIKCHRVFKTVSKPNDIYVWRLEIIKEYLQQKINVVHTDLDAFWFSKKVMNLPNDNFDLQISKGSGTPQNAFKNWGFTMCCGFYILNSNFNSLRFIDTWIEKSNNLNHDQKALNEIFLNDNIEWKENTDLNKIGFSKNFNLKIEVFNTATISRGKEEIDKTKLLIFHPYLSSPTQSEKVSEVKRRLKTLNN